MASSIADAYVQLLPSFKGGAAAISKELDGPLDSAGKDGGRRFGSGMTSGIAGMARSIFAPLAAAAAGVGIVSMLKGAVTEASGLNESINALNVSYGDASAGVQALGKSAATSLGLSNLEFNNLAVRFSSFSKTIAGEGGDVTGTLDGLTTRASDFASVMNLEVAEAAQLFQSGLAGESEPLRAFGIDLSAAAVEAYGLANGLSANGKSLTEAEKVQARYGLLMQQTAQTQGDFANTSDQLANQQRILGARWDDLKANLGSRLLPVITSVVSFLNSNMQPAFDTVSGGVRALVEAFQAGSSDVTSSGFAGVMERIGLAARVVVDIFTTTVIPGIRAMVAAFQAGGSDVTSSGLSGAMERVGLAARALADWIRSSLIPGIASLLGWLKDNATTVAIVAGVITTLLLPGLIHWGVQSAISGAKSVAAWFATETASIKSAAAHVVAGYAVVASWVRSSAAAVASGAQTVAIWALYQAEAIKGAAVTVAAHARMAAAWIATRATAVASMAATVASMVAGWAVMGAQALLGAAKVAAAWLIAMGPIGLVIAAVVGLVALIIANWDTIVAWTKQTWESVTAWLSTAWANISSGVASAWDSIVAFFAAIPGRILAFFLNWTLPGLLIKHWDSIREGASSMLGAVVDFFRSLPGRAIEAIGDLAGTLKAKGKALIQGLIDGILDKIGDIKGAIGKVATAIGDFLPGSPVKTGPLTKWNNGRAGKLLVGMLADGLSQTAEVDAAMASLTGRIAVPSAGSNSTLVAYSATNGRPGAGGPQVAVSVHPTPGMSEQQVGDMAARSVSRALGGWVG